VDTATPSGRDRALDAYRAVAIAGVVAGHWLIGAIATRPTLVGSWLASPGLAVMTGVLVAVVAWARRFERPWDGLGTHQRVLVGVLVAGFVGWAAALY